MRKRKKMKRQGVPLAFVIFVSIIIFFTIIIGIKNKKNQVRDNENIVNSNLIINKSYDKENNMKTIEIKTENFEIDSLIITNKVIEKLKNNDAEYNKSLKEILDDNKTSNRDIYNINKSIELQCVKEDTKLADYYWKITGFKSLNEFISFCEKTFELMETED